MSSLLPSPSNGYAVTVNFKISDEVWNAAIPHLAGRVEELEDVVAAGYTAAQQAGTEMAEAIIQNAVAPQIADITETIEGFQTSLALAEDQLAALQNGGVEAVNVPLEAHGVFGPGTNAQEAFALTSDYLQSIYSGIDNSPALSFNFGSQLVVNFASQAQMVAGTNETLPVSALGVAQAILATAGDVVLETFSASGTFTKQSDDIVYFVECIGGGGGGAALWEPTTTRFVSGGSGGSCAQFLIVASDIPASLSVTVGAGGAGGASTVVNTSLAGSDGGSSSFGGFATAPGGKAGVSSAASVAGTDRSMFGGIGGIGDVESGRSILGGGGGAGTRVTTGGQTLGTAGASARAGSGGEAATGTGAIVGSPGSVPGGGGGSAGSGDNGVTSCTGGAGARGEVRVYRFKRRKA